MHHPMAVSRDIRCPSKLKFSTMREFPLTHDAGCGFVTTQLFSSAATLLDAAKVTSGILSVGLVTTLVTWIAKNKLI